MNPDHPCRHHYHFKGRDTHRGFYIFECVTCTGRRLVTLTWFWQGM